MNAMGGPEIVLILAVLAVIGLGMAGLAFAVYVIVRAAAKSRPIPMAPPMPPVDSEAPRPTSDGNEARR